ncbi:MAG: hypothetical protein ABH861_03275 [Patescibacteria group bacterium]
MLPSKRSDSQPAFRRAVQALMRQYGPQGWWPRIVVERGTFIVKHHPGPKRSWLSKTSDLQAFEVAVGAILTQNTAWNNVEKALVNLAQKKLFSAGNIIEAEDSEIAACVKPAGYYKQKTKKLKALAEFAEDLGGLTKLKNYKSARSKLLSVWGIGPETADTILLYGLNIPIFVVDAYTRRFLASLSGLMEWKDASYDNVQFFCSKALNGGADLFQEAHAVMVRWGKDQGR